MKELRFLAMLLMATILPLSFTACSDDDDDDEGSNVALEDGITDLKDDGSTLSWTETKSGVASTNTLAYNSKNEITSWTIKILYPSEAIATKAKSVFEGSVYEDMYDEISQNGRTLTLQLSKYNFTGSGNVAYTTKTVKESIYPARVEAFEEGDVD